jgi:hypothetical protein
MWIPIRYRSFYDLPRMMVFNRGGRPYLLDCPFDENKDEYSDHDIAYRLPAEVADRVDSIKDWDELLAAGERLGTIRVSEIEFDETKRKAIADRGLDILC